MMAIEPSEGENIRLERPMRTEGFVETWLASLLESAQGSLHSIIRNPAFNLLDFLAQCRLNVRWTNNFEWLKQCYFYFKEDLDLRDGRHIHPPERILGLPR